MVLQSRLAAEEMSCADRQQLQGRGATWLNYETGISAVRCSRTYVRLTVQGGRHIRLLSSAAHNDRILGCCGRNAICRVYTAVVSVMKGSTSIADLVPVRN